MAEDHCTCREETIEPHSCPFQREVHDDLDDMYCTCCEYCEQICGDDI